MSFLGAKLALFIGEDLLVIRRDDRPDIPFPDFWDLPGGGREDAETPQECVLRETREEVGLVLSEDELIWSSQSVGSTGRNWFFAAHRPAADAARIRFGDEGQGWRLMVPQEYVAHDKAVPHLARHVQDYLRNRRNAA